MAHTQTSPIEHSTPPAIALADIDDADLEQLLGVAELDNDEARIDAIEHEQQRRDKERRRAARKQRAQATRDELQRLAALEEQRAKGRQQYDALRPRINANAAVIEAAVGALADTLMADGGLGATLRQAYVAAADAGFIQHRILQRRYVAASMVVHLLLQQLDIEWSRLSLTIAGSRWLRDPATGRWRGLADVLALPPLPPVGQEDREVGQEDRE